MDSVSIFHCFIWIDVNDGSTLAAIFSYIT